MSYEYNEYTKFFIEHNNCFIIEYDKSFYHKIFPCLVTEDCYFSYKDKKIYIEPFIINDIKCFRLYYNEASNIYSLNGWSCSLDSIIQNLDISKRFLIDKKSLFAFPKISKQDIIKLKLML